jgi:hypothetical protein
MNYLKNHSNTTEQRIQTYDDFWQWFSSHEQAFHKVVKRQGNVERDFFDKLSPKLDQLKEGFAFQTGMYDDHTAELVITADGVIEDIVFVEELVAAAPRMEGWKFTALKPATDIKNMVIKMSDCTFSAHNLSFYANDNPTYPDEIDITVVHDDLNEENKAIITTGTHIFLDNYLGELEFATNIDLLTITSKDEAQKEPIPITKLKDFLNWRQKEFVEKYEGVRHDTDNDTYSAFEAALDDGKPLLAVINTDLLEWDGKASHPWLLTVEIKYDGEDRNGMPDEETYQLLDEIENSILAELEDFEGYLNIGRQTADSAREIYFACSDFRKPSKVLYKVSNDYSDRIQISYEIYKDKYWHSFKRFHPAY